MKQIQQQDNSLVMKVWLYISKPFQITKVLEILYALDWVWYAIISLIPDRFISGGIFPALRDVLPKGLIINVLFLIAALHITALWKNVVWLRKFNLVFNIAILLYLSSNYLLTFPIPAGVGYLIILIGVSTFAFWRMDESH